MNTSVRSVCGVEGCSGLVNGRGLCNTHYQRWRKHGDPLFVRHTPTPEERFWAQVDKADDCWMWVGAVRSSGYGSLYVGGKNVLAHRFSYELASGEIPSGLQIDHLCRVKLCVNPEHLEAVTAGENLRRSDLATGKRSARTHCPQGHPYDDMNTLVHRSKRSCRACQRERAKTYRQLTEVS